jgi:hypothetical protein
MQPPPFPERRGHPFVSAMTVACYRAGHHLKESAIDGVAESKVDASSDCHPLGSLAV